MIRKRASLVGPVYDAPTELEGFGDTDSMPTAATNLTISYTRMSQPPVFVWWSPVHRVDRPGLSEVPDPTANRYLCTKNT